MAMIRAFAGWQEKATYFDTLPVCAIEHVIRFHSDLPRLSNRQGSVPADTVLILVRLGAFAKVARATFTNTYSVPDSSPSPSMLPGVNAPPSVMIDSSSAVPPLVSALGAGVTNMSIYHLELSQFCAQAISSNCMGLRHLSVTLSQTWGNSGALLSLLAKRGAQLETLQLGVVTGSLGGNIIKSISRRCRLVERLRISCYSFEASLEPIWEGLGACLRDVLIRKCDADLGTAEHRSEMQRHHPPFF